MDSFDILVIILSVALAFSLVVSIMVGIYLMQFLKSLKAATDSAQHAVENVEAFTTQLKNAGRATAVGTIISQVTSIFKGRGKK